MKKKFFMALILVFLLNFNVYALDNTLLDMRTSIFEESKKLKSILADAQDVVLVNSMWDSCIIVTTQLDAYFSMIGIFESIKKEDISETSVNYLINWLNTVKRSNELNIRSLKDISRKTEAKVRVRRKQLIELFTKLDDLIDDELKDLAVLKKLAMTRVTKVKIK